MSTKPTVEIESVRPATDHEWDESWRGCSHATYFHSRQWAQIWCRYSGGSITPDARTVTFSDGRRALLPLSLRRSRKGFQKRFLSSPAGTFGGWLETDGLEPTHAECLLSYIRTDLRNIILRQNPFNPGMATLPAGVSWTASDFTQVVDYGAGLETIHEILRKNQILRKYKQGVRAGLELVKVSDTAAIERYTEIYTACQDRWGEQATSHYHPELFRSLDTSSPHIDFWAVEKDGEIIAGGPFFKAGTFHVVSWLTLADPSVLGLKPYEFIYLSLIDHYGRAGFRFFDFNPSGGHEGVAQFKSSFGAVTLPANVLSLTSAPQKVADSLAPVAKRLAGHLGVQRS